MPQLLTNIRELATCRADRLPDDAGLIADAALAWNDAGRILFAGRAADLPADLRSVPKLDAHQATVIPGLVDCHTHLAFAGWRADEFTLRCRGSDYAEIAARGGGIQRTVQATRAANANDLYERAHGLVLEMARLGITTIECKSGYGLTPEDELKLLRVYRRLQSTNLSIVPTFLGAHAVPVEFANDRAAYVRLLCDHLIPDVASSGLARFCDVFVEHGAFTPDEARQILAVGKVHGLRPKLHVDQLADGGGAALAAEVGAISADHLEFANDDGLRAMAEAGVVAVLLPLASLYLHKPPIDARRCFDLGVPVAVATDFNPGSAPSYHLPFVMTLACTMNRMTPAQALRGATIVAAQAIGFEHEAGSLEPGKRADFVLLDAESVEHWLYQLRPNAAIGVYIGGVPISTPLPALRKRGGE